MSTFDDAPHDDAPPGRDEVGGDLVGGDKVGGDQVGGDKVGRDKITIYQTVAPPLDPQQRRNREAMLAKVRTIWIEGLLDQSLANELRIALNLTEQPDAVVLPLNTLVQELRRPPRSLSTGTPIIEVFDQMDGTLLILGAPGAGKTTLLLELTRDLITRAEYDERHPIPVVFNLSSWAEQRRPLAEWLVEELNTKYDVPRRIAQAWITADEMLPLLDGLDEVAAERRNECVAAINTYREEHGLVPLAVCSRVADYEALSAKLRLQGAVIVQALTPQQVEAYLERAGEKLAGVRAALRDDAELRAMLDTPLMLSIVTLAYQGTPVEGLQLGGTQDEHRRHLFDAYTTAMFGRRGRKALFSQHQTLYWLSWLAHEMQRQAQTIFLIERLQPDWLPTRTVRLQYVLLDRCIGTMLIGLVFGLVFWLVIELVIGLVYGLVIGAIFGLDFGLVYGLVIGAILVFFGGQASIETLQRRDLGRTIFDVLVGGLVGGLLVALLIGLSSGLLIRLLGGVDNWLLMALSGGPVLGLLGGPLGGLVGGLLGVLTGKPGVASRQVIVIERLRWVWSRAWRSAVSGLLGGLLVGLLVRLVQGLVYNMVGGLDDALLFGMFFGLFVGLLGGLLGGLTGGPVTATVQVNQGIRRSARSALVGGLAGALLGWLLVGLVIGLLFGLADRVGTLLGVLVGALLGALLGALAFGGYTCLSHFALRIVLSWHGSLPLRLVPFLDHCADRILLRKVGGGYIFVHRLLLEYFASLHDKDAS